ncbi:hypothetical protein SAMN04487995_3529 [Dyadobacter koreensis]|uniref:Outer membrane protein beta-barrel domain-containing protein n=1 Tax=Dyadobacter koreensis TaxID=408657 RepID=A0A1H6WFX4_9BACT|nr:hypothetical protein [Dyadobacter koreensis]SEJ15939.1 hypothetical protein SAMN04487995_3529 [Dyadobacter koreensis]
MKRKILLSCLFIITLSFNSVVFAQTDEYYRPDTVKKERPIRNEVPPVEKKAPVEKQKLESDLKNLAFKERIRLGGSFGLSFGTFTNVNVSPMAGYQITDKLVGGVGATLMWFKSSYYNYNTINYGGRAFLMYQIVPVVNIIAEYETLNVPMSYQKRTWLSSPMFGASYSQPTGGKLIRAVHFTALYNVNYNNQIDPYNLENLSPYGSPFVFRVTFL